MNEIYLIRHAKSSWDQSHLDDFDRPLDERGLRDGPRMAEAISKTWECPELILSSPAVRAYQTAQFFRDAWDVSWGSFGIRSRIYEATPEALWSLLIDEDKDLGRIALVGHNPGLSMLLNLLTGADRELKTACVARIRLDQKSLEQESARGQLIELLTPAGLA